MVVVVWSHLATMNQDVFRALIPYGFPRIRLSGSPVSGVRDSQKLNPWHYVSAETLYVGAVLCVADRGCMDELPVNGVLGNWWDKKGRGC